MKEEMKVTWGEGDEGEGERPSQIFAMSSITPVALCRLFHVVCEVEEKGVKVKMAKVKVTRVKMTRVKFCAYVLWGIFNVNPGERFLYEKRN